LVNFISLLIGLILTELVGFVNKSFVTTLATTGTALLSLSFVFAVTAQEVLGSCIFLFVKHPYDVSDRVDITGEQLVVERISLLFTVFKRVQTGKICQIPNIVLNTLWIDNITRSKAMREQLSVFVSFDTTFDDVQTLKAELQKFVQDKENSRDFQPDLDIEILGIAEMNKMELKIEIKHKSNWSNETVRAARRSKFMCALVMALRRVPIFGPGGGGAVLGSADAPSYSVSLTPEVAQQNKDAFAAGKEAKRLIPTNATQPERKKSTGGVTTGGAGAEYQAVQNLNNRNAAADPMRDDTWQSRDDVSTLDDRDRTDTNSERALIRGDSRGGRRAPDQTLQHSDSRSHMHQHPPMPTTRGHTNVRYAPPPGPAAYPQNTMATAAATDIMSAPVQTWSQQPPPQN
jgi:mechanosensitive ion channel-like protein